MERSLLHRQARLGASVSASRRQLLSPRHHVGTQPSQRAAVSSSSSGSGARDGFASLAAALKPIGRRMAVRVAAEAQPAGWKYQPLDVKSVVLKAGNTEV